MFYLFFYLKRYGGHVTDDSDRKLMLVYSNDLFREEALVDGFKLSYSDKYATHPAPLLCNGGGDTTLRA